MALEAKKLYPKARHPVCRISSLSFKVLGASISDDVGIALYPDGESGRIVEGAWMDSLSSIGEYPARLLTVVSGGGISWRTEISCAVAVPEGKASCSSMI